MGDVGRLCDLVGMPKRASEDYDWPAIEASINLTLPDDYKQLVSIFPNGRFQDFLRLKKPGDHGESRREYLGYYRHVLDDMFRQRAHDPARFPLPIYPEPGGLLPWGMSLRGDLFFWLTDYGDSNSWPIVFTDSQFSQWVRREVSVSRFLIYVVTGEFDGVQGFEPLPQLPPFFDAGDDDVAKRPQNRPRDQYWRRRGKARPVDMFDELSSIVKPATIAETAASRNETESGFTGKFPKDYLHFISRFGPGRLGDLEVISPSRIGDLAEANLSVARTLPDHPPIYPETGGVIPWGRTVDGWTCYWAPIGPDAGEWYVVVANPSLTMFNRLYGKSFSGFLLAYATAEDPWLFGSREVELTAHTSYIPLGEE